MDCENAFYIVRKVSRLLHVSITMFEHSNSFDLMYFCLCLLCVAFLVNRSELCDCSLAYLGICWEQRCEIQSSAHFHNFSPVVRKDGCSCWYIYTFLKFHKCVWNNFSVYTLVRHLSEFVAAIPHSLFSLKQVPNTYWNHQDRSCPSKFSIELRDES